MLNTGILEIAKLIVKYISRLYSHMEVDLKLLLVQDKLVPRITFKQITKQMLLYQVLWCGKKIPSFKKNLGTQNSINFLLA